jgi:hypothetical protein
MMYKVKILMYMDRINRINKIIKLYSCHLLKIVILTVIRKGIIKINRNNRI